MPEKEDDSKNSSRQLLQGIGCGWACFQRAARGLEANDHGGCGQGIEPVDLRQLVCLGVRS